MGDIIKLVPPDGSVEIFGVKLVGVNEQNGRKLLFTIGFILLLLLLSRLLRALARLILAGRGSERARFWTHQGIRLATAVVLILGIVSIWFDNPARLATALGLVTAGLAFALQRVITALAGYFIVLWGKTFNVGDRISMGGVRGDVIALSFLQTTILEMGKPPLNDSDTEQAGVWVRSRQYTGRVVTVTNDKIFAEPVYNYTREFPYIWEEMVLPISFTADHRRAERILLDVAGRLTVPLEELSQEARQEMQRRYEVRLGDLKPCVYYRITSNWLELTVRFITRTHGVRELKDAMSREILRGFDEAGIGIASTTFDIVGLPPLRIQGGSLTDGQKRPTAAAAH